MTQSTRTFVWVMRIFAAIYLVGALLFFFMPEELFYMINIGPRVLKLWDEIPMPSEHFWGALTASMMMMLFVASVYSSLYPKVRGWIVIHMISKITSVAGFIYLFARGPRYFAYALGAVTDSSVILIVLFFYLRTLTAREPATESVVPQT